MITSVIRRAPLMLGVLLWVFCSHNTRAQKEPTAQDLTNSSFNIRNDVEWSEGSLILNDGTEYKGLLKFNEDTGVLGYQSGNVSRSYTARNVVGFEFYDYTLNRQRVFYTFMYEETATDIEKPFFFEVIKEFKTFAVLTKTEPIDVERRKNQILSTPGSPVFDGTNPFLQSKATVVTSTITAYRDEIIYFMSSTGDIEPYIKFTQKAVDGTFYDRYKEKNKMLDDDLLKKYTGAHYAELEAFAEENGLKPKRKDDFFKVLEYYEVLLEEAE